MKEQDLYQPIKAYLEDQGYTVKSEVKKCDVVAVKDQDVLVVELKKNLTLKLLHQAIDRQKLCSSVYVAIPMSPAYRKRKKLNEIKRLMKRLHLGLIFVDQRPSGRVVEVALLPDFSVFREDKKAQKALMKEFNERSMDLNQGGMVKTKVVTAYREQAIHLAVYLIYHGPCQLKFIKAATGIDKAGAILSGNHYGWFERVKTGVYTFNDRYADDLKAFEALVDFYSEGVLAAMAKTEQA